jgi:hypothetical protein
MSQKVNPRILNEYLVLSLRQKTQKNSKDCTFKIRLSA